MKGYEQIRDRCRDGRHYTHLASAQLFKHALLKSWSESADEAVKKQADNVKRRFTP